MPTNYTIESVASTRSKTKEDVRVESLLPEGLRDKSAALIQLLQDYYTFLNQSGNPSYAINTINNQRDIDLADDQYLDLLQKEIAVSFPKELVANRVSLYKNLMRYYSVRGSENSIGLFFKILFNDNVSIYYPQTSMLIPSSGTWDQTAKQVMTVGGVLNVALGSNPFTMVSGSNIVTVTESGHSFTPARFPPNYPQTSVDAIPTAYVTFSGVSGTINGVPASALNTLLPIYTSIPGVSYTVILPASVTATSSGTGGGSGIYASGYNLGVYTTNQGFVSDTIKIQDSYFYQRFSYVIQTGNNVSVWKDAFNRLVHPAGFIFFGQIVILLEMINQFSLQQPNYVPYVGVNTADAQNALTVAMSGLLGLDLERIASSMPYLQPGYVSVANLPLAVFMEIVSNSTWLTLADPSPASQFIIGETVTGQTSGATATVNVAYTQLYGGTQYCNLFVNRQTGTFLNNETIIGQTSGVSKVINSSGLNGVINSAQNGQVTVGNVWMTLSLDVPRGTPVNTMLHFLDSAPIGWYAPTVLSSIPATYLFGDYTVSSVYSKNNLVVNAGSGSYTTAETVTGSISGSTATVTLYDTVGQVLELNNCSGIFLVGETVTGGTSGCSRTVATATPINNQVIQNGNILGVTLL